MVFVLLQRGKPTDPATITPLILVLRNAGESGRILDLLESACAAAPENEDLGRQLCYAYIREENYKKLQLVSAEPASSTRFVTPPSRRYLYSTSHHPRC